MKYTKKPVQIDAWPVARLCSLQHRDPERLPVEVRDAIARQVLEIHEEIVVVRTLEGRMRGQHDDWLLRGVQGEFYPCKPDIFRATYELVGE